MARSPHNNIIRRIDLRFAIGIALVLASVLGVSMLIQSLNRTVPVYVVGSAIATGDAVTIDALRIVQLNLGEATENYLTPADDIADLLATRPLQPGELVAKSGLGSAAAEDSITTVIEVSGELPAGVAVGRTVDVWAAPDGSMRLEQTVAPTAVLSGVEVVRVATSDGFASGASTTVEVRIPRGKLQGVLLAQSMGLAFTIVSVGGA